MPLPEAIVSKIFSELELDESIRMIGSVSCLNKFRVVVLFAFVLTTLIALFRLDFMVVVACVATFASYVSAVVYRKPQPKIIYALTSTRVLKVSSTEITNYAAAADIKEVKRDSIFFNDGTEPLHLLVPPDGRFPVAMVVTLKDEYSIHQQ